MKESTQFLFDGMILTKAGGIFRISFLLFWCLNLKIHNLRDKQLSFSFQQSTEACLPITEMPCMGNWGSQLARSSLFSATIKHGVLSKARHLSLSVKVTSSCLARQKAALISLASKLRRRQVRMVFHLAVLLLQLLNLSNASPQAPPPPPGRVSFFLQCSHYHPSCQSDSQEAAAAVSHIHRHQCLLLHCQALPLPHQPLEQGIIQISSKYVAR